MAPAFGNSNFFEINVNLAYLLLFMNVLKSANANDIIMPLGNILFPTVKTVLKSIKATFTIQSSEKNFTPLDKNMGSDLVLQPRD